MTKNLHKPPLDRPVGVYKMDQVIKRKIISIGCEYDHRA